jgi:hypothetical protein
MKVKAQREEIESRRAVSAGTSRQPTRSLNISKASNLSQSISSIQSPRRTYEQKENMHPTTHSPSSQHRISMCSKLQNVFKKPGTATRATIVTSNASRKTIGFVVPTPATYSIPVSTKIVYSSIKASCSQMSTRMSSYIICSNDIIDLYYFIPIRNIDFLYIHKTYDVSESTRILNHRVCFSYACY